MPFQKGNNANPRGRKTVREEIAPYVGVQALARPHVKRAVDALVRDMDKAKEGSARVSAASKIINYAEPGLENGSIIFNDGERDITVVVRFGKSDAKP